MPLLKEAVFCLGRCEWDGGESHGFTMNACCWASIHKKRSEGSKRHPRKPCTAMTRNEAALEVFWRGNTCGERKFLLVA